jgi:hypothetical protein
MADSPGIESEGKLRPLKGVNWQRRGRFFALDRVERFAMCRSQIAVIHFFNVVGSAELRSLLMIIFHSTTNLAFGPSTPITSVLSDFQLPSLCRQSLLIEAIP